MLDAVQILSLITVVLALTPALAHALEWPGKRRLPKEAYLTMQTVYYPGFTVAGFSEPVAVLATGALLLLTPVGTPAFWLNAAALCCLATMHAVYWLVTHPVNRVWLPKEKLGTAGKEFFETGSSRDREAGRTDLAADWKKLRNRWERSHIARAILAFAAFIGLTLAVVSSAEA